MPERNGASFDPEGAGPGPAPVRPSSDLGLTPEGGKKKVRPGPSVKLPEPARPEPLPRPETRRARHRPAHKRARFRRYQPKHKKKTGLLRRAPKERRYGYKVVIPKELTRTPTAIAAAEKPGGLAGLIRPRLRRQDAFDRIAWALAGGGGAATIGFALTSWFEVNWRLTEPLDEGGMVALRLLDIRIWGYAVIGIAALVLLVGLLASMGFLRRLPIDAGVVLSLLALAGIGCVLIILIGNAGIIEAAGRVSGRGGSYLRMYAEVSKRAEPGLYLGFAGLIIAWAGSLFRLSDRS
ncbi:MAG: hypothetical protein ACYC55_00570 [Candidatus Geothermincolia bacterium]